MITITINGESICIFLLHLNAKFSHSLVFLIPKMIRNNLITKESLWFYFLKCKNIGSLLSTYPMLKWFRNKFIAMLIYPKISQYWPYRYKICFYGCCHPCFKYKYTYLCTHNNVILFLTKHLLLHEYIQNLISRI